MSALQTVHVRVNDAATGEPTPVRIRFTDGGGKYYAPLGRLTKFCIDRGIDVGGNVLLGGDAYAYIDGTCEVCLPPGPLVIEIHKGPEYSPLRAETTLNPGKLALRFGVQRWADLRREGWYAGDTRAHFLSPHAALLEAAAEDLAVVNLLVTECLLPDWSRKWIKAIPNILDFSGQTPALECPGHLVVVNTHNTHEFLGSLGLLNCHRPVYPISFGGHDGPDDWTLADWCDQCHRKHGLVVWTGDYRKEQLAMGEPLADLILGKVDAIEIDFFTNEPLAVASSWYQLLNSGLRLPLVGGSAKDCNEVALGSMRTFARLSPGEAMTYRAWIEATRAGRTVASNGPLLTLTVDNHDPGAVLDLPATAQTVRVRAEARSIVPFDRLEIVLNGLVVASAEASGAPATALLETEVAAPTGGWLAARCRGEQWAFQGPINQRVFAHTSPVYLQVNGQAPPSDATAIAGLLRGLDDMLKWVQREARCETEYQRERLANVFRNALHVLNGRQA